MEKREYKYLNTQEDCFAFNRFEEYREMLYTRKAVPKHTIYLTGALGIVLVSMLVINFVAYRQSGLVGFWDFLGRDNIPIVYLWPLTVLFAGALVVTKGIYDYYSGYKSDYKSFCKVYDKLESSGARTIPDEKFTLTFSDTQILLDSNFSSRFADFCDIEYIDETDEMFIVRIKDIFKKVNLRGFDRVLITKRYFRPETLAEIADLLMRIRQGNGIPLGGMPTPFLTGERLVL